MIFKTIAIPHMAGKTAAQILGYSGSNKNQNKICKKCLITGKLLWHPRSVLHESGSLKNDIANRTPIIIGNGG